MTRGRRLAAMLGLVLAVAGCGGAGKVQGSATTGRPAGFQPVLPSPIPGYRVLDSFTTSRQGYGGHLVYLNGSQIEIDFEVLGGQLQDIDLELTYPNRQFVGDSLAGTPPPATPLGGVVNTQYFNGPKPGEYYIWLSMHGSATVLCALREQVSG